MEKNHVSYDTLLIVASNLTLAEVQATPTADKPTKGSAQYVKPEVFVCSIFDRHLARLRGQLEKP